jgi:hypothetical protein
MDDICASIGSVMAKIARSRRDLRPTQSATDAIGLDQRFHFDRPIRRHPDQLLNPATKRIVTHRRRRSGDFL